MAVESVYSMDGDQVPLKEVIEICLAHNARLIVDEAHAVGVLNETGLVCKEELEKKVFARIVTFGKALGVHGGIVLGSRQLKEYLVNFSRPFIYTTALPYDSLIAIEAAYELLKKAIRNGKIYCY